MIGSLHTGFFTPGDSEISLELRGSLGWARWNVDDEACTIQSPHPTWKIAPVRTFKIPTAKLPGYGAERLALMKVFARAIRGEGSSGYPIGEAIASLRISEAAHEAARSGRMVPLP